MSTLKNQIAYFSMEFAFDARIPNYAGGLGVLAADAMYSAADLGMNVVGVTLLYHEHDDPDKAFDPTPFMRELEERTYIDIEDRRVHVSIWQMDIRGRHGAIVPILFLSTNLPENSVWDRDLTKNLYSGDGYTRLGQEALLGIGGFNALKVMGHTDIATYHLNEGHASLLTLASLQKHAYEADKVRERCTFTTHTPIPAGHDYFDYSLVHKTLGDMVPMNIHEYATSERMGMTQLGMSLSRSTNSVSLKHQEVCEQMFPGQKIANVTNGIYHGRWVGKHMKEVFDSYFPDWEDNPTRLEKIFDTIPNKRLHEARVFEKKDFIGWINAQNDLFPYDDVNSDDYFDENVLTIGFARRFVSYKRPDLIFKDLDRLRSIGYKKIQLVFACRCHPNDAFCNTLKDSLKHYAEELRGQIRLVVLPDYNLDIAKRLITGCDIWLNTPIATREASGTSGMKASLNGILNLSVHDGWWIEGYEKNKAAGWSFGGDLHKEGIERNDENDAQALLDAVEEAIHCYQECGDEWMNRVKSAISLAGTFNTHRMMQEYMENIWKQDPLA